jgi:transcriptional regulator with XRE-family HTH domain
MSRPLKYDDTMGQKAFDLAAKGMSDVQIARDLKVSRASLYSWAEDDTKPEFKALWDARKDVRQAYYEDIVQGVLTGAITKFNAPQKDLLVRTLTTQFPDSWAENRKTTLEITDKTKHMSDKELEATITAKVRHLVGLRPELKVVDSQD